MSTSDEKKTDIKKELKVDAKKELKVDVKKESKVEDVKFAQLPRESIRLMAESTTHQDIPEDGIAVLAEDGNYRLRQVLKRAHNFTKHSFRRKLSVNDVNKALKWCDCQPIYGHSYGEPIQYIQVRDSKTSLYVAENTDVDLNKLSLKEKQYQFLSPHIIPGRSGWSAIEGVPQRGQNFSDTGFPNPFAEKITYSSQPVSENCLNYYNVITTSVLGNNDQVLVKALRDLRTNRRISPLFSYFVNFIATGVKKMSHDLVQLKKLLLTLEALMGNPNAYLGHDSYLKLIVKSVQFCIVKPFTSLNSSYDHWVLRDTAAQLLAKVLNRWSSPVNQLYTDTLDKLKFIVLDRTEAFCSHYGAIVTIVALGMQAIEKALLPHIPYYMNYLTLELENLKKKNMMQKGPDFMKCDIEISDAQKVHSLLLVVSEFIIRSWMKKESPNSDEEEPVFNSKPSTSIGPSILNISYGDSDYIPTYVCYYRALYRHFGDALSVRLPCIELDRKNAKKKDQMGTSFASSDIKQTGETILESHYKTEDEWRNSECGRRERKSSDDLRDDLSPHSDTEAVPFDLKVKSTISDPTRGIKITISKLQRKPTEDSKSKKRKLAPVSENDPVFQRSKNFLSRPQGIEINFEGSTPLPSSHLKQKKMCLPSDNFNNALNLNLRRKLRKTGKRSSNSEKLSKSEEFYRKCMSGNLNVTL